MNAALAKTALGWLGQNTNPGAIWQMFKGGVGSTKLGLKFTKDVLLGNWNKLGDSDGAAAVKLTKLAGASLFSIWGASNSLRTYEDARAAFHNSGNRDGASWYSGLQSLMYGAGAATMALGLLGPAQGLMKRMPMLAVIPGLAALGMDAFQHLATLHSDSTLARIAQVGQDNWLVDLKGNKDNAVLQGRSVLMPWWYRNIRSLDVKFANALGLEYRRADLDFDNRVGMENAVA